VFLGRDEIRWVEAAGNYLRIHARQETYTTRGTMAECEKRLDPIRFVRIHRSVIVNLQHVREVKPWYTGEYILLLSDGKELTLSRGYRSALERMTSTWDLPDAGGSRARVGHVMKYKCEKCCAELAADTEAYICSYVCTFCPQCAQQHDYVCPSCKGELVRRPRRAA
jgi:hypothetical protein